MILFSMAHYFVFFLLMSFSPPCPRHSSAAAGVLFSVEVMCSHFALRHYCPCFFSAACGALTFRLFSVWSGDIGNGGPDLHSPPHGQHGEASL